MSDIVTFDQRHRRYTDALGSLTDLKAERKTVASASELAAAEVKSAYAGSSLAKTETEAEKLAAAQSALLPYRKRITELDTQIASTRQDADRLWAEYEKACHEMEPVGSLYHDQACVCSGCTGILQEEEDVTK